MIDSNNSHVLLQRVIPIKCLRQGFRHIKMRNQHNLVSDMSSIFVYSKQQNEHFASSAQSQVHTLNANPTASNTTLNVIGNEFNMFAKPQTKHKQFKVTIYGLSSSDDDLDNDNNSGVTVKVTQDTTVLQVIEQVSFLHEDC